MRLFWNIAGRVCALWAVLVFALSMLITLIPTWLIRHRPEPERSIRMQTIFQRWMKVFFVFSGVRRRYTGRDHFVSGQQYVVVCNHRSLMDPPLSSPGIPTANKTIAKDNMARIPLFGIVYRLGAVLVNRKSEESRKASYTKMRWVLQQGMHMCIYPEGTRNRTDALLTRFHDGAFKLAVESGTPVLPALLFGTARVLPPSKSFYFRPGLVEMHFLSPIATSGRSVDAVRDESFAVMEGYLAANGGMKRLGE